MVVFDVVPDGTLGGIFPLKLTLSNMTVYGYSV
jgi:hypothetical protein